MNALIAPWRGISRWVLRRPDVPPGGVAFAHRGPLVVPILAVVGLSVVEVVVLDLLVRPWPAVRWTLLALGVGGALYCLGMLAVATVYPHVVGPAGLRVRSGALLDVRVPWDAVRAARRVRRSHRGGNVAVRDGVLTVGVLTETTVEVTLTRPVTVRGEDVTTVRLHADDPGGMVSAIRGRAEVTSGR